MGSIYWSIVMYINSRQMCALTFAGQRKCGAFGSVRASPPVTLFLMSTDEVEGTQYPLHANLS